MLTETFDPTTEAIINPTPRADAPVVDACIMTFSHVIESFVLANFETTVIGMLTAVNGDTPIYKFTWNGKQFAFFAFFPIKNLRPALRLRRVKILMHGNHHSRRIFQNNLFPALHIPLFETLCRRVVKTCVRLSRQHGFKAHILGKL